MGNVGETGRQASTWWLYHEHKVRLYWRDHVARSECAAAIVLTTYLHSLWVWITILTVDMPYHPRYRSYPVAIT
jgi:hypothetical protein